MMNWTAHIESNPKVMMGKPVIKSTRIPVDLLLEKLAEGETIDDLMEAYPPIKKDDIYAALAFASEARD